MKEAEITNPYDDSVVGKVKITTALEVEKATTLAECLAVVAKKLVVGNAIEEATECGPLICNREVERVASWVDEAVAAGAKLIAGGKKLSESCYEPTVLLNPPVNARVST